MSWYITLIFIYTLKRVKTKMKTGQHSQYVTHIVQELVVSISRMCGC